MLREGPIPRLVHGVIEYVVGVFFVAAPFLLGYDDIDMALGISIAFGVVVLVLAAITEGPTGLVKQLPVSAHVTFDFALAVFLIAAPFILGFGDEPTPRNIFIAFGVAHLLISIGTRYREAASTTEGSSRATSSARRAAAPAPASPPSRPSSPPATAPTRPPASGSSASPGANETAPSPRATPEPPVPPPAT